MFDHFPERLQNLLVERGLSQHALAQKIGTTQSSVQAWLKGAKPRARTLVDLAVALGVRPAWLADGEEPRELPIAMRQGQRIELPTDPAERSRLLSDLDQHQSQTTLAETPGSNPFDRMSNDELAAYIGSVATMARDQPAQADAHLYNIQHAASLLQSRTAPKIKYSDTPAQRQNQAP
jgi:transcriptional regulator with XRE-family HTH domain